MTLLLLWSAMVVVFLVFLKLVQRYKPALQDDSAEVLQPYEVVALVGDSHRMVRTMVAMLMSSGHITLDPVKQQLVATSGVTAFTEPWQHKIWTFFNQPRCIGGALRLGEDLLRRVFSARRWMLSQAATNIVGGLRFFGSVTLMLMPFTMPGESTPATMGLAVVLTVCLFRCGPQGDWTPTGLRTQAALKEESGLFRPEHFAPSEMAEALAWTGNLPLSIDAAVRAALLENEKRCAESCVDFGVDGIDPYVDTSAYDYVYY